MTRYDLTLYRAADELETTEDMALAWNALQVHKKRLRQQIKDAEEYVEGKILAKMKRLGITSFEEGGIRYYAGEGKKTTANDQREAAEAVLTAVGGDLSAFLDHFGANSLKTGACRETLGEAFADLFTTETVPKLKEGKPKKRLIAAKAEYVR